MNQAKPFRSLQNPAEMIRLLQNKDGEAFSILYDRYSAALFGIISKMVSNKLVAEELLQDVFVKIWNHIDRYDDAKATLFTWMAAIARNTSIDHLRSRQHNNEKKTLTGISNYTETFSEAPAIITDSDNKNIYNLSQKLDKKYRLVINLVYFIGYSQQEVATGLNLPIGTVKTRSRTVLSLLRGLFGVPNN